MARRFGTRRRKHRFGGRAQAGRDPATWLDSLRDCLPNGVVDGRPLDSTIAMRLQAGRRSPAMTGGVFSPVLEDTTHHFQKTLLQRLQAAGAIAG